jgi:acetyl esterase
MPLDPILVPLLADYPETPRVVEDYDAYRTESRQGTEALLPHVAEPGPDVHSVDDLSIPVEGGAVALRVYRPFADEPRPVHLYFHGGGWTTGSAFDLVTDITSRERAAMAGHVVVSVDYRKSPEHKFPVPLEDAYAALLWVHKHAGELGGRPDLITVGGSSAGGNIAAALALKARDERGPSIAFQLLEVPALDLTFALPSHGLFGEGYALSTWDVEAARRNYLPSAKDRSNPYASPLLAPDLGGLPRALIISAEYDVLRDEGAAYAERLNEAGVEAHFSLQRGQVHVSSAITKISPAARAWRDEIIGALRDVSGAGVAQ